MIKIDVRSELGFDFDITDVNDALRAEREFIKARLREITPQGRTGQLKSEWRLVEVRGGIVKFATKFYGLFINEGADAHLIKARRARALAVGGGRYKQVWHPGISARKFLERGQADFAHAVGQRIADRIREKVNGL